MPTLEFSYSKVSQAVHAMVQMKIDPSVTLNQADSGVNEVAGEGWNWDNEPASYRIMWVGNLELDEKGLPLNVSGINLPAALIFFDYVRRHTEMVRKIDLLFGREFDIDAEQPSVANYVHMPVDSYEETHQILSHREQQLRNAAKQNPRKTVKPAPSGAQRRREKILNRMVNQYGLTK